MRLPLMLARIDNRFFGCGLYLRAMETYAGSRYPREYVGIGEMLDVLERLG